MSLFLGCAKNALSERDQKLNQRREAAERKRAELRLVTGDYHGSFKHSTGTSQRVCLNLEIKDIPETVEGEIDPIMIPTLSGSLRFNYGSCTDSQTYISFAIKKADFNPNTEKLDMVVENSEYKEILITCQRQDPTLKGSWNAQHLGATGTLELVRGTETNDLPMKGAYGAILWRRGSDYYQFGGLVLRTTHRPPDSMNISAVVKILFGGLESKEYFTYRFDRVDFNPIIGQFTMKADGIDVSFTGNIEPGVLNGDWSSTLSGNLGKFDFKRDWIPAPPAQGELVEALGGTYKGTLENHPSYHYPKRVMVNLVTTQNLSQPNGLKISGNLRFYQGDFGSTLYYEYPFSNISYFPFIFVIKLETERFDDNQTFTLDATLEGSKIAGTLKLHGIGDVAAVEVEKE